jgi:hypothetical protein
MTVDKNTNPFITALVSPLYMIMGTMAVINGDLLIIFLFFAFNFALIGSYVTEFKLFPGLYFNELSHKASLSALMAMGIAFMGFLTSKIIQGGAETSDPSAFAASSFMLVWGALSLPSYILMVWLVKGINKRDLDAEEAVRKEKRKNQKSGGPPIMNRDGF